jgi:hypothetical protein
MPAIPWWQHFETRLFTAIFPATSLRMMKRLISQLLALLLIVPACGVQRIKPTINQSSPRRPVPEKQVPGGVDTAENGI